MSTASSWSPPRLAPSAPGLWWCKHRGRRGADPVDCIESRVAHGITSLVYKSLVTLDRSTSTTRWNLLETIRAYALEKLAAHDEIGAAARRHAEFYQDLFASRRLDSHAPSEDMEPFIREIDNVRAALDWSFSSAGDAEIGVTLTAAYVPAWLHAGLPTECRERTERAMNNLAPGMNVSLPLRMQLHFAFGLMPAYTMSPVEPGKAALAEALALAEQIGDLQAQFQILWGLWVLNSESGECHTAYAVTEQLSLVARRIGDPSASLMAQRLRGFVLEMQGQHQQLRECSEHLVRHYVAPTDRRLTAWGQFVTSASWRAPCWRGRFGSKGTRSRPWTRLGSVWRKRSARISRCRSAKRFGLRYAISR